MTGPVLEVLHVADCPLLAPLLERLQQVTDAPVTTRRVDTDAAAAELRMAGSPTLLVDGVDPFAETERVDYGIACRLFRDEDGQNVPVPSLARLRDAIGHAGSGSSGRPSAPGEVLSAWRTRTVPLEPVAKRVHRTILRTWAETGRPPRPADLDRVTVGSGRAAHEVLGDLHEGDAIRLAPDGRIAVAYPFSDAPTRHRVRIGEAIDVYAMCAIDALGISAMLDQDTRIDSVDVTTGHDVTVTMTAGRATWRPSTAVVFIGSDGGCGPSADCCCDYLNFFADRSTAAAWVAAHPRVPGEILDQAAAEDLGARLFGALLPPAGVDHVGPRRTSPAGG